MSVKEPLRIYLEELEGLDLSSWGDFVRWRVRMEPLFHAAFPEHVGRLKELTRYPFFHDQFVANEGAPSPHLAMNIQATEERMKLALLGFLGGLLAPPASPSSAPSAAPSSDGVSSAASPSSRARVRTARAESGGPTHSESLADLTEAQHALVDDQATLDAVDPDLYEALARLLRGARAITIRPASFATALAHMREKVDALWADPSAAALQRRALPQGLHVTAALDATPFLAELAKKLA